ncbi:MAG: DUF6785 family protein [Phycisphaerae bacterium]|jgi:hypothetical protein
MTLRAIILGVLAAVVIAAGGYVNNQVIPIDRMTLISGSHFPLIVFAPLLLVILLLNPLLGLFNRSWSFKPAELAVVIMMAFAGCSIPGSGMMRFFPRVLAIPVIVNHTEPSWKKYDVLGYVPPAMLPAGGRYCEQVDERLLYGYGDGHFISPGDVPWEAWRQPLATWMPMLLLLAIASICLALIVHRQWSAHERLRYPVVDFTSTLLGEASSQSILRSKVFWIGLAIVMGIRAINNLQMWFPNAVTIPMMLDITPLADKFDVLHQVPWSYEVLRPKLIPVALGFSFFLAWDVGLSLPLSLLLCSLASVLCVHAGISPASDRVRGGIFDWSRFGSCVAMVLVLAYTGRRYYWQVLKGAFVPLLSRDHADRYAVWACRILMLCMGGLVILLVRLGLDWTLAIPVVLIVLMLFLVVARLNAEAGLFMVLMNWQPVGVILALLGGAALGPKALIILGLLAVVTTADTRECLMPFMVNGLRLGDQMKVRPSRLGWAAAGAFGLALAVAVPVMLWTDYSFGLMSQGTDGFSGSRVPRWAFNTASQEIGKLSAFDQLTESENLSPVQRLTHMSPNPSFLASAGVGFAAVLVLGLLRLRLPWWPLHPIIFVVMGTLTTVYFAPSFLLGWFIKMAVTRLGGTPAYRTTKLLMIGIIAGDLIAGLLFMLISAGTSASQ